LCEETLECFCAMLGTVAGNLAVTLAAKGGIYIGGGVVPRLGSYFAQSPFRQRFESKGRFSTFNAAIPTYVITAPYPAFVGAARILRDHLGCATEGNDGGRITMKPPRPGAVQAVR
jgi:glucokinase